MTVITRILLSAIAFVPLSSAAGPVLFSETFSYPDGYLSMNSPRGPQTGGVSHGAWISIGPNLLDPVYVFDGKVTLHQRQHPTQTAPYSGEDAHRDFPPLSAGQTLYAGFDVVASGGDGSVYFAAFV